MSWYEMVIEQYEDHVETCEICGASAEHCLVGQRLLSNIKAFEDCEDY